MSEGQTRSSKLKGPSAPLEHKQRMVTPIKWIEEWIGKLRSGETDHDHLGEERGSIDAGGHATNHLFHDLFLFEEVSFVAKRFVKGLPERSDLSSEESHSVEMRLAIESVVALSVDFPHHL